MDITSVPMARGLVYLVAVVDWFSRKVLAWRLSMTLETGPCVEALSEALAWYAPRDSEHRSGQPVHLRRLSYGLAGRQDCDQHGRQGRVARQCFCRTALADDQIRGSLPARLPSRLGGASRAGPLCGILQPAPTAFLTWRANARSGLCQPANAKLGGGITRAESHLSTARKLFKEIEPPLSILVGS